GEIGFKAADYTYAMDIVPTVGKVTAPLTNFPVLVRLSESAIRGFHYDRCKADELRFALADGTMLAHEVDYWNANGESTVWVNVPELTSNTVIRAYWGFKPGREPLARSSDEAWTDYVGVWHFSEASGVVHDSSGNGYNATCSAATTSNVNAKVGLSRNTTGTTFVTSVSNLASTGNKKPLTNVSKFVASGWMLSTATIGTRQYPQFMRNKNQWNDGNGWFAGFEASPTKFNAVGSGGTRTIPDLPTSVYNNWVYLTIVYDGATTTIYEDGALVGSYAINTVTAGAYALRFADSLTGRIDEYRIHNGTTPADYIAADYATQTDPDFLTYGKVKSSAATYIILQ
ncbi:MAG: DUF2341 domain-containing protein, partial [Kiritimatiellae bacterium]|nr:DUF2341 domain-containing protein [Kiritimatiellia bacterium]